jgi:hypothetical protein
MTIREAMLREVEIAYMDAQIEDDNDYSNWEAAIAKAIELGLAAQPRPDELNGDDLRVAVDTILRHTRSGVPRTANTEYHLFRLSHLFAAHPGPRAVPEVDPIDWESVMDTAICNYEDWEKAEQGHGPLDTGWTSAYGDMLSWWVKDFALPAIENALSGEKTP